SEWAQGQSLLDRLKGEEDRYAVMFQAFVESFNKSYASDEERVFRFSVFVKNVEDFEEEESKHPGLDLDVTQFADWTEEEMIRYLSGNHREIRVDEPRFEGTSLQGNVKRPAEIDWAKAGKLTPVKDQGKTNGRR
ncbi:Cathepsin propeptide inhibitor domain protein, partial [Trichostrongylus colubriformis]